MFVAATQLHPSAAYAGDFPDGVLGNQVGPLAERNHTVGELLNALISRSTKGGMWIVSEPCKGNRPPEDAPFWKILPYGGGFEESIRELAR